MLGKDFGFPQQFLLVELTVLEVRLNAPQRTSAYFSESKVQELCNSLQKFTLVLVAVTCVALSDVEAVTRQHLQPEI
ncbi:MAG: hypothetical protein KME49_14420 [Brasilonema octagenarum HA4186-MV1]|nr:hypothetical protein [Brasilonema octagenarum HA4186-MV1]